MSHPRDPDPNETIRRTRSSRRGQQPAAAPFDDPRATTRHRRRALDADPTTTRRVPRADATLTGAGTGDSATGNAPGRRRRIRAERQVDTRSPFTRASGAARAVWLLIDALAVLALLAALVIGFQPTFDTAWLWVTVLGGGVLGMLVGWLGWRLRLVPALLVVALGACWFLFGGALAMPSSTRFGLPTMRTLRGLVSAPVSAWKGMLTLDPPIGETWNLLAVPMLLAMVVGVLSASISLRSRRPHLAWVPGVLAVLAGWALGTQTTRWPAWVSIAVVGIVLVWSSYRQRMLRETLVAQRRKVQVVQVVLGALVLALATGAVVAVLPFIHPERPRASARTAVEPPLDVHRYGSPLQALRGVHTMHQDDVMLTVEGMPEGSVLRLATMDTYDGISYAVSNDGSQVPGGAFSRVGSRIAPLVDGVQADVMVSIRGHAGPWVPTVGQTTGITFDGPRAVALGDVFYYNRVTGTGLDTLGLAEGDSYRLRAVVPTRPSDERVAEAGAGSVPMTPLDDLPDTLREQARSWSGGARTKGQAALELQRRLRQGFYSNGLPEQTVSLAGHSHDRLLSLLRNPEAMVGDEEQYAVAMALMARSLGIPARVTYGYEAPEGGSGDVRGREVRAWPELNLDGLGWVMFDPTPPEDQVLKTTQKQSPPRPRPHVENPPQPPKRPEQLPNDNNLDADPAPPLTPPSPIDWRRVGTIVAVTALPVLTLFGPIVLILGLKLRRRRLRRHHPDTSNRVAGAWAELVDRSRDLGHSPSPSATRSEQAEMMAITYPRMITDADPISLAKRADSVVFSPESIPGEQADGYWKTMNSAERGVRRSVGWRRWLTSRLSVRSFRRYR